MNNGKTPKIRFKGFKEDWVQRKLEELYVKAGSGGTPLSSNRNYYNGNIPFLSITDVTNSDGYIYKTEKYITNDGLNNSAAWIVPCGSISLAMYASVGKVAILKDNIATSQAFYNMVFDDEISKNYVYHYLKKMEITNSWDEFISKGTQANLNAETIKNYKIYLPISNEERQKYSELLFAINNLITLHQRKCDMLKNVKKFLLEKLFPKSGSSIPDVRFNCFTEDWVQRKLNEICEYNSSNLTIKDLNDNGKFELYDANNLIGMCYHQTSRSDYISIIKDGAGVGRIRKMPRNTAILSTMGAIIPICCDLDFIFFMLIKADLGNEHTGTTIPHIYFKDYGNEYYSVPNINEQHKIGTFFKHLDHLITLHQRKVEKLEKIKKSLLKNIFL